MNKKERSQQDQNTSPREKKVKRVKTHRGQTVSVSPVTIDCFQFEEAESANQTADECFAQFKETCNQLREVFQAVYVARKVNRKEFDYRGHVADACALVMKLKRLSRLDKHRCKRSRDAVNEGKQKVDSLNLQYQNLLYEVTHLQKEVTKCLEFRSQDEDIELVPVEEFYKEAPPEITKPDITRHDNHELTLARLQWELEQRKRLALKLKEAEITKENCKQSIRKLKERLDSIQPTLKSIIEATEPLQSKLGMPLQEIHLKHKVAKFLPNPLHILYVEACAYREACDKRIDVTVEGSVDDAKVFQIKHDNSVEDSGDSDQEENSNVKRHRHSVSVRPEESNKDVLKKHPLSVCVTVETDSGKMCIEFHYLFHLSIVTVSVKSLTSLKSQSLSDSFLLNPYTFLNCLFPGDNGMESPNPANKYQLQKLDYEGTPFSSDKTGWPYVWAQKISGLHFISAVDEDAGEGKNDCGMKSSYMENVINAIRLRLTTRISLSSDISSLASASSVPSYIMDLTNSSHINSKLKRWCPAVWADVVCHPSCNRLLEMDIISKDAHIYSALIERGSASLTALIFILPDYPSRSPVFLLFLQWKGSNTSATSVAVRELEEEVNVHAVEEIRSRQGMMHVDNCDMLFLYQVYHLLACFDVFLETEFSGESVEGPREFQHDKVVTRVYRGRSHSRPYKYLSSKGIFTHR